MTHHEDENSGGLVVVNVGQTLRTVDAKVANKVSRKGALRLGYAVPQDAYEASLAARSVVQTRRWLPAFIALYLAVDGLLIWVTLNEHDRGRHAAVMLLIVTLVGQAFNLVLFRLRYRGTKRAAARNAQLWPDRSSR